LEPGAAVLFGMDRFQSLFVAAALVAVALPTAACNVDVRKDESPDGKANVDITTPVGNVSVRTNGDTPAIGLAVYPGAKPLREENAPESADVAAVSKDVTANVKQAAADAAEVTAGLKKTAAKIDDAIAALDKNKIAGVVADVSAFAGNLRAAGPEIDTIVADAKKATQSATDFADNLTKHNGDVDKIVADAKDLVARVNESSKKLDELFGKANDLLGPQGGSKNFFQEAADAAKSVKTLADSLNGHIDEIAAGIEKFSDQGLANIDALVTQLRGTALRLDQAVSGIARNPSSLVFGGNSDIREYNRR